jgi:hypothetical protein
MKTLAAGLVLVTSLTCALACNKQPEPIPVDKPADPPATSTAAPAGNAHGGGTAAATGAAHPAAPASPAAPEEIGYDAPAAWTSAPNPSPMRKATFKIPKAGGEAEDAELAISAASGGVEPNVKRWEGQFADAKAKTEARTVNGLKVTIVEIKGKFSSGGMGQPAAAKADQMLLGAIVDAGDRQHFFKMTGGEKTVSAARKDFDKFVGTFRGK